MPALSLPGQRGGVESLGGAPLGGGGGIPPKVSPRHLPDCPGLREQGLASCGEREACWEGPGRRGASHCPSLLHLRVGGPPGPPQTGLPSLSHGSSISASDRLPPHHAGSTGQGPSLLWTVPLHGPGQALGQQSHTQAPTYAHAHARTRTDAHAHTYTYTHTHMRKHAHTYTNMHTHTHAWTCTCTHAHTHKHAHARTRIQSQGLSLSLSGNNRVPAWWELTPSFPPVPDSAPLQGDPGGRGPGGHAKGAWTHHEVITGARTGRPTGIVFGPFSGGTVGHCGGAGGAESHVGCPPQPLSPLSLPQLSCLCSLPPPPSLAGTWARQGLAGLPLGLGPLAVVSQALGWGLVAGSSPAPKASPTAPATAGPGSPRTPAPSS